MVLLFFTKVSLEVPERSILGKQIPYFGVENQRSGSVVGSDFIWNASSSTKSEKMFPKLRQDPLEAILVIFGRKALIFFLFESSWKKMKNDAILVRMRSGDRLGDVKMSKTGTSLRRI